MYFFFPKKRYDPTPYSRIKRMWHAIKGCPVNACEMDYDHKNDPVLKCSCGIAYVWETA